VMAKMDLAAECEVLRNSANGRLPSIRAYRGACANLVMLAGLDVNREYQFVMRIIKFSRDPVTGRVYEFWGASSVPITYVTAGLPDWQEAIPETTSLGSIVMRLSWKEPSTGGSSILGYVVEQETSTDPSTEFYDGYKLIYDGSTEFTVMGIVLEDLQYGVTYFFNVYAINSIGRSKASNAAYTVAIPLETNYFYPLSTDPSVPQNELPSTVVADVRETVVVRARNPVTEGFEVTGGRYFLASVHDGCELDLTRALCEPVPEDHPRYQDHRQRSNAPADCCYLSVDHGDGTYSLNYTGNKTGLYSLMVYAVFPHGLWGQYWDNAWFEGMPVLSRMDTNISFDWGHNSITALAGDLITARWVGYVKAPSTDDYTFYLKADDSVRFWLQDELRIDHWDSDEPVRAMPSAELWTRMFLEEGKLYHIRARLLSAGERFYASKLAIAAMACCVEAILITMSNWISMGASRLTLALLVLKGHGLVFAANHATYVNSVAFSPPSLPVGMALTSMSFGIGRISGCGDCIFNPGLCQSDPGELLLEVLCPLSLVRPVCFGGIPDSVLYSVGFLSCSLGRLQGSRQALRPDEKRPDVVDSSVSQKLWLQALDTMGNTVNSSQSVVFNVTFRGPADDPNLATRVFPEFTSRASSECILAQEKQLCFIPSDAMDCTLHAVFVSPHCWGKGDRLSLTQHPIQTSLSAAQSACGKSVEGKGKAFSAGMPSLALTAALACRLKRGRRRLQVRLKRSSSLREEPTGLARLIDGKSIAAEVRQEVRRRADALRAIGVVPGLAVILVGSRADSAAYVRSKAQAAAEVGCSVVDRHFPEEVSEDELLQCIKELNMDVTVHGILVQLPLPAGMNEQRILDAIDVRKDVDGLSAQNLGRLSQPKGVPMAVPCTPAGIMELLKRSNVELAGKECVVLGRSAIVGMPMALLLVKSDATVRICHSRTADIASACLQADVVIAAVGKPGFVRGEWLKAGCIVIDVGINRVPDASRKRGYRLVGDVDFESAREKASLITPVPGGVGPMTVAMLLRNTVSLAEQSCGIVQLST
ncbi:unnamed protein product, partial [Polarella glacialis]